MEIIVALSGNPNAGKTTLSNALTGAHQHVGNYPGVTVEKRQGAYRQNGYHIHFIDLPGTYSLTAYSLEEVVARDFLVNGKPAVVVDIVDASNLERNLYLTVQFLEMGQPVCIALNMMDVARDRDIKIDTAKLSKLIGIPVIPTVARKGEGKENLIDKVINNPPARTEPLEISYGTDIDRALLEMVPEIEDGHLLTDRYPARWTALKYLENDGQVRALGKKRNPSLSDKLEKIVRRVAAHIEDTLDSYPEAVIADHRYGYIKSIINQGVVKHRDDRSRLYLSDKIDKVLTHRFVGPLIMLAVLFGLYQFTFTYSVAPVGWLEAFFGWAGDLAQTHLPDGLVKSLITSGIIDGVGGVLGFVPLIMFMFFGIAFLEDSGYLARVAFMMDRIFRIFGLHGSSVMAFMELPPYRLPTFKGLAIHTWERTWQYIKKAGTVILGISILLWAMMTFPGLPDSDLHSFEQKREALKNAAPATIIAMLEQNSEAPLPPQAKALKDQLLAIDRSEAEAALRYSIAGRMGTALEPISRWAGFDWRTNIALVGGFAAKEVVVSTLGTAYSLGEVDPEETASLSETLAASPAWNPITALSLIIFTIFYAPCFVTVVCIVRESGTWKWGIFSMIFNTVLAFGLATLVYQAGSAMGIYGG